MRFLKLECLVDYLHLLVGFIMSSLFIQQFLIYFVELMLMKLAQPPHYYEDLQQYLESMVKLLFGMPQIFIILQVTSIILIFIVNFVVKLAQADCLQLKSLVFFCLDWLKRTLSHFF
jgi:hypothetical protein